MKRSIIYIVFALVFLPSSLLMAEETRQEREAATENIPSQYYSLDEFFSSFTKAQYLIDNKDTVTGTIQYQQFDPAQTIDISNIFTDRKIVDGQDVCIDYYGTKDGDIYRVDAYYEESEILISMNDKGITISSMDKATYEYNKTAPQMGPTDGQAPKPQPPSTGTAIDNKIVQQFVDAVSDPETIKEVEQHFGRLEEIETRRARLQEEIKKNYSELRKELVKKGVIKEKDRNVKNVSGRSQSAVSVSSDKTSADRIIMEVEKHMNFIKEGKADISPYEAAKIIKAHEAVSERTALLIERYKMALRQADSVLSRLGGLFEMMPSQVIVDNENDAIKVLINLKDKKKAVLKKNVNSKKTPRFPL